MAATVSVYFKLIDQASDRLASIADGGRKAAEKLESLRDQANGAFERLEGGAKSAEEALNGSAKAADAYARATQTATGAAEGLTGGSREAEDALREAAGAADEAERQLEEYGNEAREAGDKSRDFGEKGMDAVTGLQNALVSAGIVKLLQDIGSAFTDAAGKAAEFQNSMAKLSTIADDGAFAGMEAEIMELSQSSGRAASDLAEAAYQAISASVESASAIDFVAQANRLAAGGFTDSATAVDVLTTAINAYGMQASDAAMISDRLVNTQNLGKTTVAELAANMGQAIPTAAAFGVSLDNLASGYVTLTRNGINTANATTNLNGMLTELGDTGSEVSDVLRTMTGRSFAELMASGKSLGDVIQILGDYVDGDSTAFANLWGNIRAGKGALSIFNAGAGEFNAVLASMEENAGAADAAFSKMGDTSAVVERKFQTAGENLKIAVGNVLLPMFDNIKEAGTDILNGMTDFVNANPAVVSAVAGIATALGVFAGAVAAVTLATKAWEAAMVLLNATMAANPVFLGAAAIIAGIAGLAVAIGSIASAAEQTVDPMERLTGASQELSDKVDAQKNRVADLENMYGSLDDRVIDAKAALQEMEEELASTGKTLGELDAQTSKHLEAFQNMQDAYAATKTAIDENAGSALALAQRLSEMDAAAGKTAEQKATEAALVQRLNGLYPDMALSYDRVTGKLNMSTDAIKKYCKAKAEEARAQADMDKYIENLSQEETLKQDIAETEREIASLAQEVADKSFETYQIGYGAMTQYRDGGREVAEALEEQRAKLEELVGAHETLKGEIREYEEGLGGASEAADRTAEATGRIQGAIEGLSPEAFEAAFTEAFDSVSAEAEAYAQKVYEVRAACLSAVQSSVGLFEQVATDTSNATAKANEYLTALQSQNKYFLEYAENLQKAKEMGLSESLVAHLADGSQESAMALANIITYVTDTGTSADKAKEYIDDMNEAWGGVTEAQDILAGTMTAMNEDLIIQGEELDAHMKEAIEGLDISDTAKAAGEATMKSYWNALKEYGEKAVQRAQEYAKQVKNALSGAGGDASAFWSGHAAGTTYGESVYIAGEAGPELIVGRQGSEVFPATETAKILQAVMGLKRDNAYPAPTGEVREFSSTRTVNTNSKKKLDITINGRGGLGSMEDLKDNIMGSMEAVLMKMLAEEMEQEGEVARDW